MTDVEVGVRFGRLTVKSKILGRKSNRWRWLCVCDCGNEVNLNAYKLYSGTTKSCGCFRKDRLGDLSRKHGASKTAPYTMFYDARKRARATGLPINITPEMLSVPDVCPVLGIKIFASGGVRDQRPSLDRVVPNLGYVVGNVRVISFRANRIKSDASVEEVRAVLKYMEGHHET